MRARHLMTLVLISTMVAGCAAAPAHVSGGRQWIHVSAERFPNPGQTTPTLGWGTGPRAEVEPIVGARCVVSNDRGSWSVDTPGTIEVEPSALPFFQVSCKHEGFRDRSESLQCTPRRMQASGAGAAVGAPLGVAAGTVAAAAGPAGVIAAVAGPMILGGAAGYALAGPDTVSCSLVVLMTPAP